MRKIDNFTKMILLLYSIPVGVEKKCRFSGFMYVIIDVGTIIAFW